MITYQTTKFMTDLLQKVQVLQLAVAGVNDGHCLHVDLNSIEDHFGGTEHHISFDVTLFDGNDLVQSWDFMAQDDADVLQHTLEDLSFHISRL